MSEHLHNELEDLKKRIDDAWKLLAIEEKKKTIKALEETMQQGDFWADQEQATRVAREHEELRREVDEWSVLKEEVETLIELSKDLEKNPDEALQKDIATQTMRLEKQFQELEFYLLFFFDWLFRIKIRSPVFVCILINQFIFFH